MRLTINDDDELERSRQCSLVNTVIVVVIVVVIIIIITIIIHLAEIKVTLQEHCRDNLQHQSTERQISVIYEDFN